MGANKTYQQATNNQKSVYLVTTISIGRNAVQIRTLGSNLSSIIHVCQSLSVTSYRVLELAWEAQAHHLAKFIALLTRSKKTSK